MSDSGNEIDPIRNWEMFENYLAAKKNCEKKKGKKDPKAKSVKEWVDDETSLLIGMLEANSSLWDIYHTYYSKRDLKDIAYHLNESKDKQPENAVGTRDGERKKQQEWTEH